MKKAAPLVIALILGLLAAKMAWDMVQRRQATALNPKRPQMVIAKQGVAAGAALQPDDLTLGEVSSDVVPENVFKSPDELIGRVAQVPIIQGQAITGTLLAPRGVQPGLQAIVPPGMRAMTLEIDELRGVAGNLNSGSHVDILQTMHNERTGMTVARMIAQNVLITSVGMHRSPQDQNQDGGGHSVTVLVSPQQCELLTLAAATGRPNLVLRSSNDLAPVATRGVSMSDLLGGHLADRHDELTNSQPTAAPTTQPTVDSTTRPSNYMADATTRPIEADEWTMQIVRGGAEQSVKFALHDESGTGTQMSSTSGD
jgi:pilus assembly protein CpaB